MQLLLNFLRLLKASKKKVAVTREIPSLKTRTVLNTLADKMYHLKKDFTEFVKMSSIHGVRNLNGNSKEKIFWLSVISVASATFIRVTSAYYEAITQNQLFVQYDPEPWSTNEVF